MGLVIIRQRARPENPDQKLLPLVTHPLSARVTLATNLPTFGTRAPKRPELCKIRKGFCADINLIKYGSGVNCGPKDGRAHGVFVAIARSRRAASRFARCAGDSRVGSALVRMDGQSRRSMNLA